MRHAFSQSENDTDKGCCNPSATASAMPQARSCGSRCARARQLHFEVVVCDEREVPPIAREPAVTNVRDAPVGHRCEVDDQFNARAIAAVGDTTTEDHLTLPTSAPA